MSAGWKGTFHKRAHLGQITAVAFLTESILLVGSGPYLKIYNVTTGDLLGEHHIFAQSRVHGFHLDPRRISNDEQQSAQIAISGGKFLKVYKLSVSSTSNKISVDLTVLREFPIFRDWIKDVHWIMKDTRTELALAFSHNFVEIWNYNESRPIYAVQCQERCLLYAARFFQKEDGDIILASGTVFNQVLLWNIRDRDENNDGRVAKALVGHEGVIFNIRFSTDGSKLASASDDRTVRVWHTDFETKSHPIVLYGHTARIWDCKIIGNDRVISVSEDSSCRVWDLESEECVACWEGHEGRNVWSVDVDPAQKLVVTGGGDSGIRIWSLSSLQQNKIDSENQLVSLRPDQGSAESRESAVKTFKLLNSSQGVICSGSGSFYITNEGQPLYLIHSDPVFSRYTVMATTTNSDMLACGGMSGELLLLETKPSHRHHKFFPHKGKITQLLLHPVPSDAWHLFTFSEQEEQLLLHSIHLVNDSFQTTKLAAFNLPEHFCVVNLAYSHHSGVLLLTSRQGAIAAYDLSGVDATTQDVDHKLLSPRAVQRRVHGKDSVTSVVFQSGEFGDNQRILFGTVGRDGNYCRFELIRQPVSATNSEPAWTLEQCFKSKITKGWLEKIIFVDGVTLLCGFFNKRFFVYNESKRYEMFSVACGGGHRIWDFVSNDQHINVATFGFIRHAALHQVFRNNDEDKCFKEPKLQDSYAGMETRVIRIVPFPSESIPPDTSVIVSGGEDSVLRFHSFSTQNGLQSLLNVRKHGSVVRSASFAQAQYGTLMFTVGAREELRAWRLVMDKHVGFMCLDLSAAPLVSKIAETRLMDVSSFLLKTSTTNDRSNLYLVATACSDSYVRIWMFDEARSVFQLLAMSNIHGRCVLKTRLLQVEGTEGAAILLVSGGTDGVLNVWDCTRLGAEVSEGAVPSAVVDLGQPLCSHRSHQSGINALDVRQLTRNSSEPVIQIVSGGDDNAISASYIRLKVGRSGAEMVSQSLAVVPAPHSSGVTGLRAVKDDMFLTTSVDQRLNLWMMNSSDPSVLRIELVNSTYLDIADLSDLDASMISDNSLRMAVAGFGLQLLDCTFP
ncbi:WD40-repeat-containing domain protein [Phlyctochytrium arcticum]|nr:WD40-repeat-containing domain protein [Phlyctochytrium arcticum]